MQADSDLADDRRWGLIVLGLALLPTLMAIGSVPWFVTQDGPAHLYNAQILAESLKPVSTFRDVYEVRWEPLPNWAGHLALMGLVSTLPARQADRVAMSLTLVGFAGSIVWLRWRVAGWRGMPLASGLAVILSLNVAWLFGFTSFLLGACLFPITLGVWWGSRGRSLILVASLLVVGYFCHLVSLGLTAVGLVVLAATTRGPGRSGRLARTVGALLVILAPLGLIYRGLMRRGGATEPIWGHLTDPWSLRSWKGQLGWVDPISLGSKIMAPFVDRPWIGFGLLAPVFWLGLALIPLVAGTFRRSNDRRGWGILALALLAGGVAGPDTFGPSHGNYLPQRVVLLGLVAVVPFLELNSRTWEGRLAGACLAVAVIVQSAFVWDYALESNRRAGAFMAVAPEVGSGQRVATLLVDIRGRFRANPLLHVDNMLGIGTGNVIWSNYETAHYYFPVQFRAGIARPPAREFEAVALLAGPENAAERIARWDRLLDAHHREIDVLVVSGRDPALDALDARWFAPVPIGRGGNVRVLRHRSIQ